VAKCSRDAVTEPNNDNLVDRASQGDKVIRVFSHWVQPATIIGVVSDFAFILLGIGIAFAWIGQGLPVEVDVVVIYSLILAVTMLMLNA
jgi:hypothetical protein